MEKRDYYEILEIERSASTAEIKKAYKKVALKLHPDRNPGDAEAEEGFKQASEAFEVLSNDDKRQVYDRYGHAGLEGRGYHGFGNVQDVFSQFQDIFGDLFGGGFGGAGFGGGGGRRASGGRMPGSHIRTAMQLTLAEAAFGAVKDIEIRHMKPCDPCGGTGAKDGKRETCSTCGGRGQVARGHGPIVIATTCPSCQGQGVIAVERCRDCMGRGEVPHERTVRVTVPGGVDDGQTLRLAGQGAEGRMGGPPGHLFVAIVVEPHPLFQRDGHELIYDLHVSFPQAALGAELDVPTLDEQTERLQIPAGIQPGDTMVIEGAGVPRLDGRGRGDLVAVIHVDVPKELSTRARELLEELAKTFTDDAE